MRRETTGAARGDTADGVGPDVAADSRRTRDGEDPLVSVIVPARNEAEQLPRALDSLAALDTELSYEVIVVDGDSDDDTALVARERGATVLSQRGSGIGAARDLGARASCGRWLAFVDADTRVHETYLDEMIGLARRRDLVAVSSRARVTGCERVRVAEFVTNRIFPRSSRPILPGFNTVVRRDAYEATGGYRNAPNEDKALSRDLAAIGETGFHPDVLVTTSARRFGRLGLVGTTLHYLRLDLAALRVDDAGDTIGAGVVLALGLSLVLALLQTYHAVVLGHVQALLAAAGFVGGPMVFAMDFSRRRIFPASVAVLGVQVADWFRAGFDHGAFGLLTYGTSVALALLLVGCTLAWGTDLAYAPADPTA